MKILASGKSRFGQISLLPGCQRFLQHGHHLLDLRQNLRAAEGDDHAVRSESAPFEGVGEKSNRVEVASISERLPSQG